MTPPRSESALLAPFAATVIALARTTDERVNAGSAVVILEAMKMDSR
jgi:acetyl/propionyl-CoA carboxylase alpha subunit